MALFRNVWKTKLATSVAESELSVVREDRKSDILFSLVEVQGRVRRRLTFTLDNHQALELARFLAGISSIFPPELEALETLDEGFRDEPTQPISLEGTKPKPDEE